MKAPKIGTFSDKDPMSNYTEKKFFNVSLGNGTHHSFSNKKRLTKFFFDTNEFLLQHIFELNKIYIEIFSEYRKLWFYFDENTMANNAERFDEDIPYINKQFAMIIERSKWENGNYNVFQQFRAIIKMLDNNLKELIAIQKAKSNYVEKRNLEVINSRLTVIGQEIEDYGKNEKSLVERKENISMYSGIVVSNSKGINISTEKKAKPVQAKRSGDSNL